MVRTVYLAVAIQAIFTQHILVGTATATGKPLSAIGKARMEGRCMALLAKGGTTGAEQPRMDRTVSAVAQGAIFCDRGMLPQERAAFLLMTAQAIVVQ